MYKYEELCRKTQFVYILLSQVIMTIIKNRTKHIYIKQVYAQNLEGNKKMIILLIWYDYSF